MYHFATALVRYLWKICSLTLLSINELDENHKWYAMMCVEGSSIGFPSNLKISKGNLDGTIDHEGPWAIGSFVNCKKPGKSNIVRKGNDGNE
jgi:hypothetical protein